jgi:hypothetical protein
VFYFRLNANNSIGLTHIRASIVGISTTPIDTRIQINDTTKATMLAIAIDSDRVELRGILTLWVHFQYKTTLLLKGVK